MPKEVSFTLGGKEIQVPPIMYFDTLEMVWPAIQAFGQAPDNIARVGIAAKVIAGALLKTKPELTALAIKQGLKVSLNDGVNERETLLKAYGDLLDASGLVPRGEAEPAATPAPETGTNSTEISTGSSPS